MTSTPEERAESIIEIREGARPLFSEKLSVAWVRSDISDVCMISVFCHVLNHGIPGRKVHISNKVNG